ncbi:MAG TPA: ABC transporter ATP-binding protein [Planctomycetota bacterium]|nr:ABC transporter ATP-binding protein [Planctomycetota bacterium]
MSTSDSSPTGAPAKPAPPPALVPPRSRAQPDSAYLKIRKALKYAVPYRRWMLLWGVCVLLYTFANAGVVMVLSRIDRPFSGDGAAVAVPIPLREPVPNAPVWTLDANGNRQPGTKELPGDWIVAPKEQIKAPPSAANLMGAGSAQPMHLDLPQLQWLLLAVGACLILKFVTDFGREYAGRIIGSYIAVDLQEVCIQKLLQLPISHFVGKQQGQTYITMTTDIRQVGAVTSLALRVIREPIAIAGLIAATFIVHPTLAAIGLLGVPLILIQVRWLGKVIRAQTTNIRGASARLLDAVDRVAKGIRMIKVYRAEQFEAANHHVISQKIFKSAKRMIRAQSISRPLTDFIGMVFIVIAIAAAGWLYLSNLIHISPSQVLALVVALTQVQPALKRLTQAWEEVNTALPSIDRMDDILQIKPAIVDAPDAIDLEVYHGPIEFRHVDFKYETESVLRDVNFTVNEGETIGIVGQTGSGKSTLTSLLARFYDPTGGGVLIDGRPLKSIKLDAWMRQLALVDQNSFVFNATVHENIRYGRPAASEEEIVAAAKAAHIYDEFNETTEGLNTNCGDLGGNISGGQRQRLALARAILKNAPILILDEATSSLDPAVEAQVQADIDAMLQNRKRTTFIVAHRLTTLRHVDRIIVLDGTGNIEAIGPREELLKPGVSPTFKRMWEHNQTK